MCSALHHGTSTACYVRAHLGFKVLCVCTTKRNLLMWPSGQKCIIAVHLVLCFSSAPIKDLFMSGYRVQRICMRLGNTMYERPGTSFAGFGKKHASSAVDCRNLLTSLQTHRLLALWLPTSWAVADVITCTGIADCLQHEPSKPVCP